MFGARIPVTQFWKEFGVVIHREERWARQGLSTKKNTLSLRGGGLSKEEERLEKKKKILGGRCKKEGGRGAGPVEGVSH